MKAILALALIFVAASASVVPDWKNCGAENAPWVPINVTLDDSIAHNTPNGIHGCGNVTAPFTVAGYNLVAKEFGVGVIDKNKTMSEPLTFQVGELYCLNYNFTIPTYVIGSFTLQFSPMDAQGNILGCIQADASLFF